MDIVELVGRLRPAVIAAAIAFTALAFSLFDELGGFTIERDQDDRSLAIGLLFTVIWLVLLYWPPGDESPFNTKGKRKGKSKGSDNGSD